MIFYYKNRTREKREQTLKRISVHETEDGIEIWCGQYSVGVKAPNKEIDLGVTYFCTDEYVKAVEDALKHLKQNKAKDDKWKSALYQLCEDVYHIQIQFACELRDKFNVMQILYMWKQVRRDVVVGVLVGMMKE